MTNHGKHILPVRTYLAVAAALFVFTAITVSVSFIDLGGLNAIIAVGIASIKALLVAFFFMHLLYDKKLNLFVFAIGIIFVGLFISLTMADTLRRSDLYDFTAEPISKEAGMYQKAASDTVDRHSESNEKH